jgi:hypothetical protein
MIRTGLTHSVCKPDNLPLDTAYEIAGTGNDMDYYCSCITSENVIHVFINDWSGGAGSVLKHFYSDNDGKDWSEETIYSPGAQIYFVGCDFLTSTNDIYLVVMDDPCDLRIIIGTKTGPYTWTWSLPSAVFASLNWWVNRGAVTIHVLTALHWYVCVGGWWLGAIYYSPQWWETIDGGTNWTEVAGGIEGHLLASYYDAGHSRIINVKGHN